MLILAPDRDSIPGMPATHPTRSGRERWTVYILRCADGSFYTGIAKNVDRRVDAHNRGKGAAYTRSHRPVVVVYRENMQSRVAALLREIDIKRLTRQKKKLLIRDGPPNRRRLKQSRTPPNPWKKIFGKRVRPR